LVGLNKTAKSDVTFSWVALAVKDATRAIGVSSETSEPNTPKSPSEEEDNNNNQPPANEPAPSVTPTVAPPTVKPTAEPPVSPEVSSVAPATQQPSETQPQNNGGAEPVVPVENPGL